MFLPVIHESFCCFFFFFFRTAPAGVKIERGNDVRQWNSNSNACKDISALSVLLLELVKRQKSNAEKDKLKARRDRSGCSPGPITPSWPPSSQLSTWTALTWVTEASFLRLAADCEASITTNSVAVESVIHGFPVLTSLVSQRAQLVLGFHLSSWAGEFGGPLQSTLKEDSRVPPWGPWGPAESHWGCGGQLEEMSQQSDWSDGSWSGRSPAQRQSSRVWSGQTDGENKCAAALAWRAESALFGGRSAHFDWRRSRGFEDHKALKPACKLCSSCYSIHPWMKSCLHTCESQ